MQAWMDRYNLAAEFIAMHNPVERSSSHVTHEVRETIITYTTARYRAAVCLILIPRIRGLDGQGPNFRINSGLSLTWRAQKRAMRHMLMGLINSFTAALFWKEAKGYNIPTKGSSWPVYIAVVGKRDSLLCSTQSCVKFPSDWCR